jgi:indoleamine 2,3-dioxygenase
LGNIRIVQNFLGGVDEDWFILIHVDIEARAAQALAAIPAILDAADKQDAEILAKGLAEVVAALKGMNQTMLRMPEYCDPYIYYTRVRPYIFGTKNNPSLPNGLIYEGCYENKPQQFRGETGAQSSIVPTLDGLLGITHKNDPLKEYLLEMREYMLPLHKKFIETVETESKVKEVVAKFKDHSQLAAQYQQCIDELHTFRSKHLEYAASYIHKQGLQANNSTEVGTGGTPFMTYLAKHRDETVSPVK